MDKVQLRRLARTRAQGLSPEARAVASRSVESRLKAELSQLSYQSIGLYMPLADEPTLLELYKELEQAGKSLYLPRVLDRERIAFYPYRSGDELETSKHFALSEPSAELEPLAEPLDVLIVPAVHYSGLYRLGRGRGYYDRYINLYPPRLAIGVSLGILGEASFEPDPWDKPMDLALQPQPSLKLDE